MAIKDFIDGVLQKRREEKAMQKQAEAEDRIIQKIEMKKKTPMERELDKYNKQDYQRKVEQKVLKIRRQKKYDAEMKSIPINQKSIFRDSKNKNLFDSPNIFTQKPFKLGNYNNFRDKNIFVTKEVKL